MKKRLLLFPLALFLAASLSCNQAEEEDAETPPAKPETMTKKGESQPAEPKPVEKNAQGEEAKPDPEGERKPAPKKKNFILYVSNQSFKVDPVHILVFIDGKKVIDAEFHVKNQHNWVHHSFSLAKGTHKIVAKTKEGDAHLEKEITIEKKHWAVIDFGAVHKEGVVVKKYFSFLIQDKQIYFR
ncbi:MAG: hypothetical protein ACYTHN_02710 [Planctomycetota bacterium]